MPVPFQASYNAGELSPKLYGRPDLVKYQSGVKTALNFICDVHGGASNRPGTRFLAEVKDSSKIHRLIPFQFSTTQSYALEFGDTTMRVFKDGAIVTESNVTITGVTQANPGVVAAVAHGYSDGDWVIVTTVVGMIELNGKTFKVANKTDDAFELNDINDNNIDTSGYTAYTSGGVANKIYEITIPYASADLSDLAYAQSADVMYITHPDYFPRKLSRTGHTSWTIEELPVVDGPYSPKIAGDEDIVIEPSARTGDNIAITSSEDLFVAAMVGKPFRVGYVNPTDAEEISWGWGNIDQVTDAQNARIDIVEDFGYELITNPKFKSNLSSWGDLSIVPGTLTYDSDNSYAVLTNLVAGYGYMRQAAAVAANKTYSLSIVVVAAPTQIRVYVGHDDDNRDDIMAIQTINAPGTYTYKFNSIYDEVLISIDTNGSVADDISKISSVSMIQGGLSTEFWRQPAWTSAKGYPRSVTFFEQRLFFAGTTNEPQTVWSSKTSDFENFGFTTPFLDSDSLLYTMDSRQVNAIQWLTTAGVLVAGTSRAEWKMFSGSNADAMTPSSIYAKEQTFYGSSSPGLIPLNIANSLLFVQRGSKSVRNLQYSLDVDRLAGTDLAILSNHLLDGYDINEWGYADLPDSVLWCIRSDGTLLGFTYLSEQEVAAWHRHTTDGAFESLAVVSSPTTDETYFIVNRTINGSTVRYVEFLEKRITDAETYDYFFVDSGLTYSGSAETVITGLDHLEGKAVSVIADGEVVEGKTVESGQITLTRAATLVHVGLPYESDLEPLDIETGDRSGATQGKKKIIGSVVVHFLDTRGAKIGPDSSHLDEISFSDEADGDNPPPLFTGKKEKNFQTGYSNSARVFIRQSQPLPITVLSIIPQVENSDR